MTRPMTPRAARQAAIRYIADVIEAQGSTDAVASFLRLPLWLGDDRHPHVHQVADAVDVVLAELASEAMTPKALDALRQRSQEAHGER